MISFPPHVRADAAVAQVPARQAWAYREKKRTFSVVLDADPVWEVYVEGKEPFAQIRIYYIEAKTDGDAAMEGLRRFTAEMEAPFMLTKG